MAFKEMRSQKNTGNESRQATGILQRDLRDERLAL